MLKHYSQTNLALGSEVVLTIVCDDSDSKHAYELLEKLWLSVYQFERRFSRFLPNSELSLFNRSAGCKIPISSEFNEILRASKQMSKKTAGLYNPFVLPALQRAGYTQSFAEGYSNDQHDNYSAYQVVEHTLLELEGSFAMIPYGTAIDLGGCGKGFLADQLAAMAHHAWIVGYWFSVGGDIVGEGFDIDNSPWRISVFNTFELEQVGNWVINTSGQQFAVATSGTSERKGHNWHHIIDPRTQKPATSDISQATVYSTTGIEADVLASCAIILGTAEGTKLLKKCEVQAALMKGASPDGEFIEKSFGKALNKKVGQYA